MTTSRDPQLPLLLTLAAPAVLLLAAAAWLMGSALGGQQPFAAPEDLTLSEATAIRDEAEVVRQIAAGIDPNTPARIRPGFLSSRESVLTPLETAVTARHVETVYLLLQNGATPDVATLSTLICLAEGSDAPDVASMLRARIPAGGVVRCDPRVPPS
jgi:hypothetical protein